MAAFMIARIEVTNLEGYMKYASQTVACAEKFGGKFLVKGGPMEQLEGSGPDRHVVIEFKDMAAAKAFYTSDEYQKILPIALANSKRDAVLVQGA
jgi:uncharacterized protein (DUF1330 family)